MSMCPNPPAGREFPMHHSLLLGEHTHAVLHDLLGLRADEIAEY